jgi:hypothetical protein
MTLRAILAKYHQPAGLAGGSTTAALERDLARYARRNAAVYAVLFIVLVVILVAVSVMVIFDVRDGRGVRTGVLAGAGITFPVILEMTRRTVREWSKTDLVRILCRRLEASQVQAVIGQLLKDSGL